MNKFIHLTSVCTLIFVLTSCHQEQPVCLDGVAQGSYYSIRYYDARNRNLQHEIDSIFRAVDNSVSLWEPNSTIRKVNRNEDVELDRIFIDNFNIAMKAAELSNGLFDPTISPLVTAWGFSYNNREDMTDAKIDSLRQMVDYRKVRIENNRLVKDDPRMSLDFNAVAQGYTSDIIGAFLESQGIGNYLINTGGEILSRGCKPNGKPWVVGIEAPAKEWDSAPVIQACIELTDKGLVTSGSTRKYIEDNGQRYSHSIDPRTGCSVQHNLLSVSVIAETAAWADALASVFMLKGMDKAIGMLDSLDSVEAYFIYWDDQTNNFGTYATEGFVLL